MHEKRDSLHHLFNALSLFPFDVHVRKAIIAFDSLLKWKVIQNGTHQKDLKIQSNL